MSAEELFCVISDRHRLGGALLLPVNGKTPEQQQKIREEISAAFAEGFDVTVSPLSNAANLTTNRLLGQPPARPMARPCMTVRASRENTPIIRQVARALHERPGFRDQLDALLNPPSMQPANSQTR